MSDLWPALGSATGIMLEMREGIGTDRRIGVVPDEFRAIGDGAEPMPSCSIPERTAPRVKLGVVEAEARPTR